MNAIELLTKQHQKVAQLFRAIQASASATEKRRLFEELAGNLVAHDAIERKIFYPACEEAMGLSDLLGEALVEHGVIEFALYQGSEALGKDDFDFKLEVLKELVQHHVEEEEKEFFPQAKDKLGEGSLDLLGKELAAAFEREVAADYRQPLFDNLRQVLAGALKTLPAQGKAPKARSLAR